MFIFNLLATQNFKKIFEECNLLKLSYEAHYIYDKQKTDSNLNKNYDFSNAQTMPFKDGLDHIAGCVVKQGKTIFIVCHGSVHQIHWWLNAGVCMQNFYLNKSLIGKVHTGVLLKSEKTYENLIKILDQLMESDSSLKLLGHSQGGALVEVLDLKLKYFHPQIPINICTMGSPAVFDIHAANIFERVILPQNHQRIIISQGIFRDPVPFVLPYPYVHAQSQLIKIPPISYFSHPHYYKNYMRSIARLAGRTHLL